jgi:hypothetical protein
MPTSNIILTVVNGARQPWRPGTNVLVTAMNGRQKLVVRDFVKMPADGRIGLPNLPVQDNLDDRFTVLVSAKDHADAGFTPVRIEADRTHTLNLMMLRRAADFTFEPFGSLKGDAHLQAFFCGTDPNHSADAEAEYDELQQKNKPALACLLNIAAALNQVTLAAHEDLETNPLSSFKALESAYQDRIFAWVDARLEKQIAATAQMPASAGVTRFVKAPAGMHEGATVSYKQIDFGEGNVQFSFHSNTQTVNGVECVKVDVDIDYFKDTAAHLLFEVFPNTLKAKIHGKHASASLTDPRKVYGMRWIAGQRFGRPFEPLYTLS